MRGSREVELFSSAMLATLNIPKNSGKGSWLNMPRWRIWRKIFEESAEVFTAYLWLCWAEVCHERKNTYWTLMDVLEARRRLMEEAADLAVCVMFLSDSTGALYATNPPESRSASSNF